MRYLQSHCARKWPEIQYSRGGADCSDGVGDESYQMIKVLVCTVAASKLYIEQMCARLWGRGGVLFAFPEWSIQHPIHQASRTMLEVSRKAQTGLLGTLSSSPMFYYSTCALYTTIFVYVPPLHFEANLPSAINPHDPFNFDEF